MLLGHCTVADLTFSKQPCLAGTRPRTTAWLSSCCWRWRRRCPRGRRRGRPPRRRWTAWHGRCPAGACACCTPAWGLAHALRYCWNPRYNLYGFGFCASMELGPVWRMRLLRSLLGSGPHVPPCPSPVLAAPLAACSLPAADKVAHIVCIPFEPLSS